MLPKVVRYISLLVHCNLR